MEQAIHLPTLGNLWLEMGDTMQIQSGDIRCWVFGSSRPLSEGDPILTQRLARFFSQWNSHGAPVSGRWRILDNRFLVVLREPEGAEVSGCSIDSMVGEVKLLEQELQTRLLDSSRIFYRTAEGAVAAVNRLEFKALAAEGKSPRTRKCSIPPSPGFPNWSRASFPNR